MPYFIFIQQISILNILNMLYNLRFFFSSKCRLFHNATLFGFCITHILNTGCAKIWKKSVTKRLTSVRWRVEAENWCTRRRIKRYVTSKIKPLKWNALGLSPAPPRLEKELPTSWHCLPPDHHINLVRDTPFVPTPFHNVGKGHITTRP